VWINVPMGCDAAELDTGSRPGTIGVLCGCDVALWQREAGAAGAVFAAPADPALARLLVNSCGVARARQIESSRARITVIWSISI